MSIIVGWWYMGEGTRMQLLQMSDTYLDRNDKWEVIEDNEKFLIAIPSLLNTENPTAILIRIKE